MARRAFYSFHYELDNWRAAQVRNMGVVDGNKPAMDNDWETVKRGGDRAIEKWIDNQLYGKSVAIILIGEKTAGRKWIKYEIKSAWQAGKGVLGVHIHNLKDSAGQTTVKGRNPFEEFQIDRTSMANIVKTYDPSNWLITSAYEDIKNNLAAWIETAIEIRNRYG